MSTSTFPAFSLAAIGGLAIGLATFAQPPAPAPAASPSEPQRAAQAPRPSIYDEKADAKQQIAEALRKARRENRRVLIQWGANWCGWCHLLHTKFKQDRAIARELMYEYDVVLVDIGKWDKHMDLAESYGADLKGTGVPYLTILGADGQVLANQETSSLEGPDAEGKPGHDSTKIMALLTKHQAPHLQAEAVLAAGLSEAQSTNRNTFLHFGAPWCGWCHRLEDWMALPDIAQLLAKDFVDLKIDEDRMLGAKAVEARFRGEDAGGGIPWFVFLDHAGKPIATSDGPEGNTGFPYQDAEIAHFVTMLKKAARSLTPVDIEFMRRSLVDNRERIEAANRSAAPQGG